MALTNTLDRSDAQVSPAMACTYIFTQICASVCSTYTLSMLFNHLKVPNNPLGVPVPGDGATVVGALLMETVCTFSLTMCILILMIHGEDTDNEKEGLAASGRDVLKKGKAQMRRRACNRVYGKHCSYRHSDFLFVDFYFNVLYRVVAFEQARTVYTKKTDN